MTIVFGSGSAQHAGPLSEKKSCFCTCGTDAAPAPRHPCAQFGKTLRPALWDGRLLWAGTEVAERWAGYIDGGIRSGEKAAADAAMLVGSA